MSKHKRRGRRGGFQAIPYTAQLSLSTLADNTVLTGNFLGGTFVEDFYCVSVDALWSINGLTAGEVPIEAGFNHGDLSVTEIGEALDAEILDPSDIIARERARRPVRRAVKFSEGAATEMVINNGTEVRTPLRFMVNDGKAIQFWVANRSGGALTTGSRVEISGTLYGRWAH